MEICLNFVLTVTLTLRRLRSLQQQQHRCTNLTVVRSLMEVLLPDELFLVIHATQNFCNESFSFSSSSPPPL